MGKYLSLRSKWLKTVVIGLVFALIVTVLFCKSAYADEGVIETTFFGGLKDDNNGCGVYMVINLVIDILTLGVGIISVIGIIISGITYITAGGSEARTMLAKKRIYEIVIGMAVYVTVWALMSFLLPGGTLNFNATCPEGSVSDDTSQIDVNGVRRMSRTNYRLNSNKNRYRLSNSSADSGAISNTAQKIIATATEFAAKFQSNGIRYLHSSGWSSWNGVKNSGHAICHSLVNIVAKKNGILKEGGRLRLGKGKILGGAGSLIKDRVKIRTNVNSKLSTLVEKGQLLPGDIVGAQGNEHSMIYKGYKNGKYYFMTAGRQSTNTGSKNGSFVANKIKNNDSYSGSYKVGVIIRAK